ncbi:MAG: ribosome assembly RNA-binding protein YhbY [Erysipelotrichales bacterium]|nr:ribosome assembly RNA-binding protein YhbY [Erysipelotrichales bacterium]
MITTKQKVHLRSLAHSLKPVFQIGKEGISANQIIDLSNYLHKYELMKVSILNNCLESPENLIAEIEANDIMVIQLIGKTLVLYKQNKKLAKSIDLSKIK